MKKILITAEYNGKRLQKVIEPSASVLKTVGNLCVVLGGIHKVTVDEIIYGEDGSQRLTDGHALA